MASGVRRQPVRSVSRAIRGFMALVVVAAGVAPVQAGVALRLVSARSGIEGSFLGSQAIYADGQHVYLASYQGKLFVLARDRAAGFPVLEVIQTSAAPLTAVRGDRTHLYVTGADGQLYIYRKARPLSLTGTLPIGKFPLGALHVGDAKVYVSTGHARLAGDERRIFLSALNENDVGLEVDKQTLQRGWTGEPREPNATFVFDRRSGRRLTGLGNPPVIRGSIGVANLYVDDRVVAQTVPGCCGAAIYLRDPTTLELVQVVDRRFTNTVVRQGRWLIAGNETGLIDVFDLARTPVTLAASADLRRLTGRLGVEDIEVRALWVDQVDRLIFAASSWGNDASRRIDLPAFFVLEIEEDRSVNR
jgi:hypothetical protein